MSPSATTRNTASKGTHQTEGPTRLWLDPSLPLKERVRRYMARELGMLHPLDVAIASVDLIRECGKKRSFEGMQHARDILDRLLEEKRFVNQQAGREQVIVPAKVFQTIMYGWSNQAGRVKFATERMREILSIMVEEHEYDVKVSKLRNKDGGETAEGKSSSISVNANASTDATTSTDSDNEPHADIDVYEASTCQPTTDTYNTLIQGLAQASYRSISAAVEAEKVLQRMSRVNRTHGWHTKPNTKSYSLVINAYARTRHSTCGDRAEALLQRMIQAHHQEKLLYKEKFGHEYDPIIPTNNRRQIVTPNAVIYSAAIHAHAQSGASGYGAKVLTLLLQFLQADGIRAPPDSALFTSAIDAFATLAHKSKSEKNRIASAKRAEEILLMLVDEIKQRSDGSNGTVNESGLSSLRGDIRPFNACIKAWANTDTHDSAMQAERVLHQMYDSSKQQLTGVEPNTVSFNIVLQAWAKAARKDPGAPGKADELLRVLISQQYPTATDSAADVSDGPSVSSQIHPDIQSYTTVMNAHAQSEHPNKTANARRILPELISTFSGHDDTTITSIPFTVVLNAAAHSDKGSASGANVVDEFGMYTEANDDPYEIAMQTYQELQDDLYEIGVSPDHIAYATMLEVVWRHTADSSIERKQRIEQVFHDACSSGQVSALVVRALMKACESHGRVQELLQTRLPLDQIDTVGMLPAAWTNNVPAQFRRIQEDSRKRSKQRKQPQQKQQR